LPYRRRASAPVWPLTSSAPAAPGPTPGHLKNVALHRPDALGPIVRQVQYTYYDGSTNNPYGSVGDLEKAIIEHKDGTALDTSYYRYYTDRISGSSSMHGLKYVFNAESFGRLVGAVGDPTTTNLSDSQVSAFADQYFEYDGNGRVTREDVQGDGASGASANPSVGTYTYTYTTPASASSDYNSWAVQTVEMLPDGNTNTVYTNPYGEVLLTDFQQGSGANAQHWDTYQQYEATPAQTVKLS
jgi:hypothetical protein